MNIYFLKINLKSLWKIFICTFLNIYFCTMSFAGNTYLNDYGKQFNNLYNVSFGGGGNFIPYCRTNDSDIVSYNTIYASANLQADTVIQTFDTVRSFGFFPYTGIEFGYTTLNWHLTKLNAKQYRYGKTWYVCALVGVETNANNRVRCVPQFGLGMSSSLMPRKLEDIANNIGIGMALSLADVMSKDTNKIDHIGIIFINKYVIKVRFGTEYEFHLHIGYSYNHFLFYEIEDKLKTPICILLRGCGRGVFNVFVNGRFNIVYNKSLEDINWFNDDFVYKIEKRKWVMSFGGVLGQYYTVEKNNNNNGVIGQKQINPILTNKYGGVDLDFSIPFLLHFSEIHYLGLYVDVILAFGKNESQSIADIFKAYSNAKCGIIICSKYKSFRSEHRFGGFIFTNGSFLAEREISQQNYEGPPPVEQNGQPNAAVSSFDEQKDLLKHTLSDHFTYSYKIYFSISPIWISKYLKNIIKISSVYVEFNLILWTKMNNKTYYKVAISNEKSEYRINYSLAKLDSISIGICL